MTLNPEVIEERLRRLRGVIRNLRALGTVSKQEFVSSYRNTWPTERGLQLAAEILFDVGTHILAGHFNVYPSDYEDVIRHLGEQGVISGALHERLSGLGGFRNLLVHGYMDVDPSRVYDHLQGGLVDFVDFAKEIETFLERA